jgi:hypothetical protein
MATREHRINRIMRSLGRFRRVNFGRNDSRLILKNPEYRRMLRAAGRRLQAGAGLASAYAEMASDEAREAEAGEWVDVLIVDVSDEAR